MAKATKKAATKKTAAKKSGPQSAPKKGAAKKGASKKVASKKVVAKKAAGKKVASKTAAKKAPQKVAAKKAPQKNVASKKMATKKLATKQAPPKKVVRMSDESMLEKLFQDSLQDMYYAEKSAAKAMPKLSKAATSPELRQVLDQHLEITMGQVQRLEQVFESMGQKAKGKKCEAIEGLIKEANEMVQDTRKGSSTRDVAIIMASQKMEHYEIASYGSMATLAAQMGLSQVKELLGATLQEEKDADAQLTQIAEGFINEDAEAEGDESEVSTEGSEGGDEEVEGDIKEDATED